MELYSNETLTTTGPCGQTLDQFYSDPAIEHTWKDNVISPQKKLRKQYQHVEGQPPQEKETEERSVAPEVA